MLLNARQFSFHVRVFKFICAKLGIAWTAAPKYQSNFSCCENFRKYNGSFRAQHLHVVVSSIAKPPVDAFVLVVTADACSMVNLVCLFMKPHPIALL